MVLKAFYTFAALMGTATGAILMYGVVEQARENPMSMIGTAFNVGIVCGGVIYSYRKYGKDIKALFHETKLNHLQSQRAERKADVALIGLQLLANPEQQKKLDSMVGIIDRE